ncbi:unnamed protein product, partial [Ectocarpus sp. 4 AP-2014]
GDSDAVAAGGGGGGGGIGGAGNGGDEAQPRALAPGAAAAAAARKRATPPEGAAVPTAAASVVRSPAARLLPRMGSSGTLGSGLRGGVGVGVGEGVIGRSRRESAILNALAKGSSLQEAVRDKGLGGGTRSVSVGGDLSSLSASSMIEAGEAAVGTGAGAMDSTAVEPAAAVMAAAEGLKMSRTSSIDRVSSSPQLPHGSDMLLDAGAAGSLPMAEAADSGSGAQPGGMRVSSAPQAPAAAAAAAGSSAGGLGGLVPKRNRRLDISGQNKFTPRKDYPPSSMLFQAMRTHYGNDYSSRDLPDTPAACWALVVSAQEARRGTRKLSTANYMQEQPATYDAESTRAPPSPSAGQWRTLNGGSGSAGGGKLGA